jgi:hypothetical protein
LRCCASRWRGSDFASAGAIFTIELDEPVIGWLGLDSIREAIEQGNAEFPEYRLPVVLSLLGRDDEAIGIVDARLEELGDADNSFAQDFRAYTERFKEHVARAR